MDFSLQSVSSGLMKEQAASEVMQCNEYTGRYGLTLTPAQALELVEARSRALLDNRRVEFGGGVIGEMIREFCDSPYLSAHSYTKTLEELLELFYYYKNETGDQIGDSDLIRFMKRSFDGPCQGSLSLLADRELCGMARALRAGASAESLLEDFPGSGEEAEGADE